MNPKNFTVRTARLLAILSAILLSIVAVAPLAAQKAADVEAKDRAALVEGNNQFALDLYRQLGKQPGNKFFSPYSISSALGMTYAGAKGKTAQEMADTLHFNLDHERLHPAFGDLIRRIHGTNKKRDFQLTTANSLWGNLSLKPYAEFLRITQTDYQAGFQLVDIMFDAEGARKKINGWVEDKTNKKIKDPLQSLEPHTRLVLVNAIYFKGTWIGQFPKNQTNPQEFTVPGTPAFKTPTMRQTFFVKHMGNDDFQLAQLPYVDDEVSMVIILPKKKNGLTEVEKKLSSKMLQQSIAQAKMTYVHMSLPKFKMTESFSLGNDLKALGMKEAFLSNADFTGIAAKTSLSPLFIQSVIHKVFVDVGEGGTEAAATTIIDMGVEIVKAEDVPPTPIPFKADHPFLFLVRHNATGSILFMGRVNDPRGK